MSTLKELMDLGKELGYEGERLADFVKEQQASERDSRQEEREKVKEEKEKLELEIRLAQIKQKRDGSADSSTSLSNDHHSWGAWTTKLIPHFDEEDVGKFFRSFEKVANQLGWHRETWSVLVQSMFRGRAQLAYSSLNDEDSADYEKVKVAVLNAYEMVPEAYRLKFRKYSKSDKDTYVEFLRNKSVMFEDWLRAGKIESFDDLKNAVILEDFKYNLPVTIRAHLEEFNIGSAGEAAQAADRYILSHDLSHKGNNWRPSSNFKNNFVGNSGYKRMGKGKRSVTEDDEESVSSGDSSVKNFSEGANQVSRKQVVCYACQKVGHIRVNCPELKGTVALITETGPGCKWDSMKLRRDFGKHLCEGQIKVKDSDEGKKVVMLRDSGATRSCVLRSCLPDDFEGRGDHFILLEGFNRSVVSCPLENLMLDSRQYRGSFKFAIVDTLPVEGIQVIIANDISRLCKRRSGARVQNHNSFNHPGWKRGLRQEDSRNFCVDVVPPRYVRELGSGGGRRSYKSKRKPNSWLC